MALLPDVTEQIHCSKPIRSWYRTVDTARPGGLMMYGAAQPRATIIERTRSHESRAIPNLGRHQLNFKPRLAHCTPSSECPSVVETDTRIRYLR